MHDETDKLVIAHLREVHAELKGINDKLLEHDQRFHGLDRRLDDLRALVEHTRGLAMLQQTTMRQLEAGSATAETWRKQMDSRLGQIERHCAALAQRPVG